MSIFVLNIATMLGLALAIDYSLFIVSRFREELRRGRTVGEAVERAVATAGKAVAFSGVAVAIGLSGLLLFEAPAIRSIGIAGALVVLCSVVFALTFLPAVLGMLGHRVNALSLGGLAPPLPAGRRRRRAGADRPLGARRPRRHAPADRGPRPDPGRSCSSPAARSCASSRACPAPRSTRPASRAATRTSPSRPSSPRARRRRSSSSPTSRARRPTSPTSRPSTPTPAQVDGARGHRPGREPVHHPRPADRRAADARTGRRALRPARRPATGRARRPPRAVRPRHHRPARRDQPAAAVRARGDRPDPGHPRDPGPGDGITTQVGGSAATGHDFLVSQAERAPYAVGLTLARQRPHPVPAVRVARHPDQGRDHDPAVDHRQLRRAGLDLPGGQPVRTCSTSSRSGTPSRATRSSCSA